VLEGWGEAVLSQIVEVSIDMSGNYKGLVNKPLPNVDVVATDFMLWKIVNQEQIRLEWFTQTHQKKIKLCRELLKQLKQMPCFTKARRELTDSQKNKLEEIRERWWSH